MSANADVLHIGEVVEGLSSEAARPEVEPLVETSAWNPEDFAREQIRGLVRRVFFSGVGPPVRQVVFSAAEAETNVGAICEEVARELASETRGSIAIVSREPRAVATAQAGRHRGRVAPLKARSDQIGMNLWRVSEMGVRESGEESRTGRYWPSCLSELRDEFDYAVIHAPPAGASSEAALLGQLTDGVILVLEAHHTRKASARRIKEALESAQARILGIVLSERTFPIPARIYRRL